MPINKPYNGKKLAKDLIKKRENEGLTLRKVEEKTGISLSVLHSIESEKSFNLNSLHAICNFLGEPVQTYF